jgi:hypothetical protein
MIKFENKLYNICIPLGEECYTCESIDKKFNKNIRLCAFPFDYVGHTFIENINNYIKNDIYRITMEDIDIKLFGDNYFYVDKKYGFKYWHDTSYKTLIEFTDNKNNEFIEKYNRRYIRFFENIKDNNKSILYISVNHFDNIYNDIYKKDKLIDLYNTLYNINNNITFIAFNFDQYDFSHKNLIHFNLHYNKNKNFQESKENFMQKLFEKISIMIT